MMTKTSKLRFGGFSSKIYDKCMIILKYGLVSLTMWMVKIKEGRV